MGDEFQIYCPYCGERLEIYVDPEDRGSYIQDCEVCCNPMRVIVSGHGEERYVYATRADGSE